MGDPNQNLLDDVAVNLVENTNELDTSQINLNLEITLLCFGLLFMILGLIENTLTLFIFYKAPKLRDSASAFIISLSFIDIIFCLLVLPFDSIRYFNNTWTQNDFLCKMVAFLRFGYVRVNTYTICAISINRYVKIVHQRYYSTIYQKKYTLIMIGVILVFSFGLLTPAIVGIWGKIEYSKQFNTCTIVKNTKGDFLMLVFLVINFILPSFIILICYFRIFLKVYGSVNRMRGYDLPNSTEIKFENDNFTEIKKNSVEWKLTKMVLMIFCGFLTCSCPILIIKYVDYKMEYPGLYVSGCLLLYFSVCVNPIIYVYMNKQYKKVICSIICCANRNGIDLESTN